MKRGSGAALLRAGKGVDRLAYLLAGLFALDRALKLAAVVHFFARRQPPDPEAWPGVTLLQPVTRGASRLRENLLARMHLDYPAPVQHLLICDAADTASQSVCRDVLASARTPSAQLLLVECTTGEVASKIEKLSRALPLASEMVLCFVDDDVALRPDALRILMRYLYEPRAGAVFGLACYASWETVWSSLMSAFVNANALLSYVPLTYLTEPFTITGHCFALRRSTFDAAGGLDGMESRVDDDHALAFRLRELGLRCVQTPLVYEVANELGSWHAYAEQLKRWFVFPRAALAPYLSRKEQFVTVLGSLGNLLPPMLTALAIVARRRAALASCAVTFALFAAAQGLLEGHFLHRRMPLRRWPLMGLVALVTPLHITWILRGDSRVEWRGQRLRIARGGRFEVLDDPSPAHRASGRASGRSRGGSA